MAVDLTKNASPIDLMRRTSAFLQQDVDNEVAVTYPTGTTEVYTFKNGSTTYFAITLTYADSTKAQLTSAKRTA